MSRGGASVDPKILRKLAKHDRAIGRLQKKLAETRRLQASLAEVVEGRTEPFGRLVASSAINRTLVSDTREELKVVKALSGRTVATCAIDRTLVRGLEGDVTSLKSQSESSLRRLQFLTLRVQGLSRRMMKERE